MKRILFFYVLLCYCATAASVPTANGNNSRTGWNSNETVLTPSNVSRLTKLCQFPVDDVVYAHVLYKPAVNIGNTPTNLAIVATMGGSLYAFNTSTCAQVWHATLGNPFVTSTDDLYYGNIGCLSTPVIDEAASRVYAVCASTASAWKLYQVSLITGAILNAGGTTIGGQVPGVGDAGRIPADPTDGPNLLFFPVQQLQRPALLLANGNVYIGFGSYGDSRPFHGWIFAYSTTSLTQTAIICLSPNSFGASIWQSGGGFPSDASGNVYVSTSNGYSGAGLNGGDYSQSMVKLSGSTLAVLDYFTVAEYSPENDLDADLGSTRPILIPGTELLVGAGKDLRVFSVDSTNMGQLQGSGSVPQVWMTNAGDPHGAFGGVAFGNGNYYIANACGSIYRYALSGSTFSTTAAAMSAVTYPNMGAQLFGTSNGGSNSILWAIIPDQDQSIWWDTTGTLKAFDGSTLAELYSVSIGHPTKFVPPTVADGLVIVANRDMAVQVFGLPPAAPSLNITNTHNGNFTQGQTGNYTLSVSNIGAAATDGTMVTVADTLPSGLTVTAMSGAGWSCNLSTVSCTRSDPLAFNNSYPAIGLTVTLAKNIPVSLATNATVSGGGQSNSHIISSSDTVTVTQVVSSISATGGTPQSTMAGTPFANVLQATMKDAGGAGVPGLMATFSASGGSGAHAWGGGVSGGTFTGGSLSATAMTNASGVATSPVFTANNTAGAFTVTASAPGLSQNASFSLTNSASAATGASATFVKIDSTTAGNWRSVYGADGYNIIGDLSSNPSYAAPVASGQASYTWASSSSDVRAPLKASGSADRIASTWYAANSFVIDSNINDSAPHQVALYLLDWDTTTRRETIDVLDSNGNVLNSQALNTSFKSGVYVVWNVTGHVKFRITLNGGINAVVSGLFFDGPAASAPPPPPTATAVFVNADTTTQGNWRSVYGAEGYNIIGDLASNPSYAAPVASGQLSYVWVDSTTDPRALQKVSNPSDRIAATWYSSDPFLIDTNITDSATHQVAIYCLDWDTLNRRQTIDVLDANSTVLNTQSLTMSFNGGVYLVWNVTGHVKFRVTWNEGSNAVVSGLFFR